MVHYHEVQDTHLMHLHNHVHDHLVEEIHDVHEMQKMQTSSDPSSLEKVITRKRKQRGKKNKSLPISSLYLLIDEV